jgi:hypothetical protein
VCVAVGHIAFFLVLSPIIRNIVGFRRKQKFKKTGDGRINAPSAASALPSSFKSGRRGSTRDAFHASKLLFLLKPPKES